MDFLFGKKKTPAELLKQHQRALQKAQRDLDRERTKLEQQEQKLISDLKKTAKAGQMGAVKVMAKDLVRTRKYIQKFFQMKANLQAVGLKVQTLRSNQAMADAMKGVTKLMKTMNKQMNLPQIQQIMMDFEKESDLMDMKEEMMEDAVDMAMGDENEESEADEVVNRVLDELGIQLDGQLGVVPSGGLSTGTAAKAKETPQPEAILSDDSLQARLDALKK